MKSRTKARSIALQILYEIDISGHPAGVVIEQKLQEEIILPALYNFVCEIVNGVNPIFGDLDKFIAECAPEWPMDQVAVIDRNIIRIALWEFAVSECTPVKVAINEAIELAKLFGSDSTPRFVNGVLGSLVARRNDIKKIIS